MAKIDEWLKQCESRGGSDLHLSSGTPISLRVDGDLLPISKQPVSAEDLEAIIFEILSEDEREKFLSNKNLDKSYRVPGVGNFRVNIFMQARGIAAVLRTIPEEIPDPETLGVPKSVLAAAEEGKGLILVTGPTGSGKSTTLAAIINHLNEREHFHILTVEDPIEFVHHGKRSVVNQREIGSHCENFSDALKYALREDPDVILVGEMRDLETISLAMTAAETGHLVFGTLHTRGAGASVDRIIDSFPANQQAMVRTMLSESLTAVVSQCLMKKASGKGRVAAYEVLIANHAISNLIREGKTFQIPSAMQTGGREGMIQMDQHIVNLVDEGIVSPFEAEGYMEDPTPMRSRKDQWVDPAAQKGMADQLRSSADKSIRMSRPKKEAPKAQEKVDIGEVPAAAPAPATKSAAPPKVPAMPAAKAAPPAAPKVPASPPPAAVAPKPAPPAPAAPKMPPAAPTPPAPSAKTAPPPAAKVPAPAPPQPQAPANPAPPAPQPPQAEENSLGTMGDFQADSTEIRSMERDEASGLFEADGSRPLPPPPKKKAS